MKNYHVINWLGLISCIPKLWQDKLINDYIHHVSDEFDINKQTPYITSRIAYQKLIEPLINPPTSQKSLEKSLNINNIEWNKVYMLPRIVTIESSLRSFNIRY